MKKVLALIAALVVATLAFAGCGGSQSSSSSSSSSAAQTSGTKTLKVGATAVPHAEILEAAKPLLEKEGIKHRHRRACAEPVRLRLPGT